MARLATLISGTGLFFPVLENIMTDPNDKEKPGLFLELFPHPLSRLYLTLLWKINMEQDGDAVLLSNVWLRTFTKIDYKSLKKYRSLLHDRKIILGQAIRSGREYLYRLVSPSHRLPFNNSETDLEAIARLRNPTRVKEVARERVMRRYRKPLVEEEKPKPLAHGQPRKLSSLSSWDDVW
jgi:hypothetical protein